jgi:hypothetical protein
MTQEPLGAPPVPLAHSLGYHPLAQGPPIESTGLKIDLWAQWRITVT